MSDDVKTAQNKGGIWCFRGQHLLPKGAEYVNAADGATTCLEHQNVPPREVNLAGSLA